MQWGFLNETKLTFNQVYLSVFVFNLRGFRASDTNDPIFLKSQKRKTNIHECPFVKFGR